jgi:hypothetical protein
MHHTTLLKFLFCLVPFFDFSFHGQRPSHLHGDGKKKNSLFGIFMQ